MAQFRGCLEDGEYHPIAVEQHAAGGRCGSECGDPMLLGRLRIRSSQRAVQRLDLLPVPDWSANSRLRL